MSIEGRILRAVEGLREDINALRTTTEMIRVMLCHLMEKEVILMGIAEDLKANVDTLEADVTAENAGIDSAIALVTGQTSMIADLQVKLDAAIAVGNLDEIKKASDRIKVQNDAIAAKTQALAAAVVVQPPAPESTPAA